MISNRPLPCWLAVMLGAVLFATQPSAGTAAPYDALVALFTEWREFQKPKLVDGVPDYTARAMAAQHRALPPSAAALPPSTRAAGPCPSRSTGTSFAPR